MKQTTKQILLGCISIFVITTGLANTTIPIINQSQTDSIQIYYQICKFDRGTLQSCVLANSPTPLIKPNSRLDFEVADDVGYYSMFYALKVTIVAQDKKQYTKDFKSNWDHERNSCVNYGEGALLFNIIDPYQTITCTPAAVAY